MKKIIILVVLIALGGVGGVLVYKKVAAPVEIVQFVHDPGDYFVTDISGSKSLLKTDIMILMRDDQIKADIAEDNHRIRNDIIFILRSKTEQELKTPGIESSLNDEIIAKLNADFEMEDFLKIYFNEFVIQ